MLDSTCLELYGAKAWILVFTCIQFKVDIEGSVVDKDWSLVSSQHRSLPVNTVLKLNDTSRSAAVPLSQFLPPSGSKRVMSKAELRNGGCV